MKKKKDWARLQYEKHKRHSKHFAKPGVHDFVVILDNLKTTFNIGKIFRSADAFGAREVHLIGTEYFLTQPAKGAFKHVPAFFHEEFSSCYQQLIKDDYTFFTLEPDAEQSLREVSFPLKSAFVFGNEELGISFDGSQYKGLRAMRIQQFGKVQSLNVSVAASIVMYEYLGQIV